VRTFCPAWGYRQFLTGVDQVRLWTFGLRQTAPPACQPSLVGDFREVSPLRTMLRADPTRDCRLWICRLWRCGLHLRWLEWCDPAFFYGYSAMLGLRVLRRHMPATATRQYGKASTLTTIAVCVFPAELGRTRTAPKGRAGKCAQGPHR